jgi:hypothetical protein
VHKDHYRSILVNRNKVRGHRAQQWHSKLLKKAAQENFQCTSLLSLGLHFGCNVRDGGLRDVQMSSGFQPLDIGPIGELTDATQDVCQEHSLAGDIDVPFVVHGVGKRIAVVGLAILLLCATNRVR